MRKEQPSASRGGREPSPLMKRLENMVARPKRRNSAGGGACSRHISGCGTCNLNPFRFDVLIGGLLLATTCCSSNTFMVHAVREASFSCPNPDAVGDDGTCIPSSESPPTNGNSAGTTATHHHPALQKDIYHHNIQRHTSSRQGSHYQSTTNRLSSIYSGTPPRSC